MKCSGIVGNWFVSSAAMTLATMLATTSVFFRRYASVRRTDAFYHLFIAGTDVEMCESFNLNKTLYESSTVTKIAERFEPNIVLWALCFCHFHISNAIITFLVCLFFKSGKTWQ